MPPEPEPAPGEDPGPVLPTGAEPSHRPAPIAAGASLTPSFRAIFDGESGYVWSTLQYLGVQHRDLEDVAHEVFITVHRRLADYDPSRPIRPWLFGIALRTAMRYRGLSRHRREVIGAELEAIDEGPSAEQRLEALEARRLVAEALDELDLPHRAVLVMHDIDGHDVPDIARALDVPLNTAYTRLRRARLRFAAAVKANRTRRERP